MRMCIEWYKNEKLLIMKSNGGRKEILITRELRKWLCPDKRLSTVNWTNRRVIKVGWC